MSEIENGEGGSIPAAEEQDRFALFGGYPRGVAWLLFSFRGRIDRRTWWLGNLAVGFGWYLLVMVAGFVTLVGLEMAGLSMDASEAAALRVGVILLLAGSWSWLALGAKWMHDNGWKFLGWGVGLSLSFGPFGLVIATGIQVSGLPDGLGALVLAFVLVWLYVAGFKAGSPGDNTFGDPVPATGVVLGPPTTRAAS